MQAPQINTQAVNQAELMQNIDAALKEAPPKDIMTGKVLDELMYYITPIISLIAFALIIIYGVIPNATAMSEKIQEVNTLKEQDAAIKARITKLESIKDNLTSLSAVIEKIDAIVPEGKTEVVKFSQRIREAINVNMGRFVGDAGEPAIEMHEIRTGETELATTGVEIQGLKVNQVPTEFSLTGGLQRFRQFFINLYDGKDFFVVDQMNLAYDSANHTWNGEVSLVKYQFTKDVNFNASAVYGAVSENAIPNQKVIAFLQTKFVENILNGNDN